MAPVPVAPTIRYYPPGLRKVYWATSIVNPAAPSRAELDGGLDLSAEILAMGGWAVAAATVSITDIPSRFQSQLPAGVSLVDSSISFYVSVNGTDIRQYIGLGSRGFVVDLWEGDVAGQFMDVFPVRVVSWAPDDGIDAEQIAAGFALAGLPATRVPVPGPPWVALSAAASGAALSPTITGAGQANAGLAAGTATALSPTAQARAGLASASGAAKTPTVVTGTAANAGLASASAWAAVNAVTGNANAGLASASAWAAVN